MKIIGTKDDCKDSFFPMLCKIKRRAQNIERSQIEKQHKVVFSALIKIDVSRINNCRPNNDNSKDRT